MFISETSTEILYLTAKLGNGITENINRVNISKIRTIKLTEAQNLSETRLEFARVTRGGS